MPETVPRPPWMYNTPYLQEIYRSNQAAIDAQWQAWAAQNPERAAQLQQNYNPLQPSGGSPNYQPPNQQNWPGGNMPIYDMDPTLGGFNNPFNPGAGPNYGMDTGGSNPSSGTGGFDWQKLLINLGLNFAANKVLGGRTSEEKALREFSTAPYESGNIQQFLPPALRENITGPMTLQGLMRIAEMLRNPGGLRGDVADAIRPRLAQESQTIAQNYRGIGSNQAGMLARTNAPVSIKNALQSALDVAQERAQRGARQTALSESEGLRREDTGQTYKLLDALLQFTSSGRGQAIPGLARSAEMSGTRQAAQQASYGNILSNIWNR